MQICVPRPDETFQCSRAPTRDACQDPTALAGLCVTTFSLPWGQPGQEPARTGSLQTGLPRPLSHPHACKARVGRTLNRGPGCPEACAQWSLQPRGTPWSGGRPSVTAGTGMLFTKIRLGFWKQKSPTILQVAIFFSVHFTISQFSIHPVTARPALSLGLSPVEADR